MSFSVQHFYPPQIIFSDPTTRKSQPAWSHRVFLSLSGQLLILQEPHFQKAFSDLPRANLPWTTLPRTHHLPQGHLGLLPIQFPHGPRSIFSRNTCKRLWEKTYFNGQWKCKLIQDGQLVYLSFDPVIPPPGIFFLQMYSKVCKWAHLQGNQRCIAYSTTSKN